MDYTRLTLAEIGAGLEAVARDAEETFGGLDGGQLNWRPDEKRWSVAQCFEHLLLIDRLMIAAAEQALAPSGRRTLWQRLPLFPRAIGRMLIRSQSPQNTRKFSTVAKVRPAASVVDPEVIRTFVEQHRAAAATVRGFDPERAERTIMSSPLLSVVTYSVLDGLRLVVAHDRRHVEQARRVLLSPGFP